MEARDTGVVLRTRPLTETSLVVHWLTQEAGRVATVAKGARRPTSPFRGKLDLCHVARITYQRSRRSELHTLREVALIESFPELRGSIEGLRTAAGAARMLERLLETETPAGQAYPLFLHLLKFTASDPENPLPRLWFEWHLLTDQGVAPDPDQAKLSRGARAILGRLHGHPLSLPPIRLSALQIRELRSLLDGLWDTALGWVPDAQGVRR